jgi:hypothetical protein
MNSKNEILKANWLLNKIGPYAATLVFNWESGEVQTLLN